MSIDSSTAGPKVVMKAVPATGADPSASILGMEVLKTSDGKPSVLSGNGLMKEQAPVTGSATVCSEYRGKGLIVESSGTHVKIKFKNAAQEKKHEELHNALVKDALDQGYGPDLIINVSRGWIESADGHVIEYLHNTKKSALLTDMRMLYHDALGQSYSDVVWHDFIPNDRGSTSDPLPFQQRQNTDALRNLKNFSPETVRTPQLKEFHFAQKLHRGLTDLFDKQRDAVPVSTETGSRKAQLTRLKEKYEKVDELIIGYHASHPLPDLSEFTGKDAGQNKFNAISEYRNAAKTYLADAVKKNESKITLRRDSNKPDVQEAIDKLALEMALSACATRADYDRMCLAFETKPNRTAPEMFVVQLSHLVATGGNVNKYIDDHFDIFFNGLTHPEDIDAIRKGVAILVNTTIPAELSDTRLASADAATYNARVEQLEMVKKQGIIAKAQNDLADELGKKRFDLSDIIRDTQLLADALEGLANSLNSADSKDEAYIPFADQISERVKTQEALIKKLEESPDQKGLRPIINKFRTIQQHQQALGAFIAEKDRIITKFRSTTPLAPIAANLS